jgi:hypothetical protein
VKKTVATFALVGGLILAGAPVLAADPSAGLQRAAQKEVLVKRSKELARRGQGTKLGAVQHAEIARQQRAIKDLIRRLEAGENVAPGEIDRILQARNP